MSFNSKRIVGDILSQLSEKINNSGIFETYLRFHVVIEQNVGAFNISMHERRRTWSVKMNQTQCYAVSYI